MNRKTKRTKLSRGESRVRSKQCDMAKAVIQARYDAACARVRQLGKPTLSEEAGWVALRMEQENPWLKRHVSPEVAL